MSKMVEAMTEERLLSTQVRFTLELFCATVVQPFTYMMRPGESDSQQGKEGVELNA